MQDRLDTARKAILEAGDYLKDRFLKRHTVVIKDDNTELLGEDLKSEEILLSAIRASFPSDSFFTEERDTEITSDLIWVIDPVCGSYSYLRGVETWSLSMALIRGNEYLLGIVYQPLLGNLFYAEKGKGAYKNDSRIAVSRMDTLSDAFVSVEHNVFKSEKVRIMDLVRDIKRVRVGHGSGGEISYVSAGYLDAVIKTGQTLMHFAGGRAILEEAGGIFVDFNGTNCPTYFDKNRKVDYVATNPVLVQKILAYCRF